MKPRVEGVSEDRPEGGRRERAFPWYDSPRLNAYVQARRYIVRQCPERLEEFERALSVFKIDPGFSVVRVDEVFDDARLEAMRRLIRSLPFQTLNAYELRDFGRHLLRNHPYFTDLQAELVDFVGAQVGQSLEVSYNFLSLYYHRGSCAPHLDSPLATWTLDVCIDQSRPWPIYIGPVDDWPLEPERLGQAWEAQVRTGTAFSAYVVHPGDGLIFSGSNQWHYRDPRPDPRSDDYCHLIFFHFMPAGSSSLQRPARWEAHFAIPGLTRAVSPFLRGRGGAGP